MEKANIRDNNGTVVVVAVEAKKRVTNVLNGNYLIFLFLFFSLLDVPTVLLLRGWAMVGEILPVLSPDLGLLYVICHCSILI